MAAAPDGADPDVRPELTNAQVELFTDIMLGKLALGYVTGRDDDERPLRRDEIQQVIVDTLILAGAPDPEALLEQWAAE